MKYEFLESKKKLELLGNLGLGVIYFKVFHCRVENVHFKDQFFLIGKKKEMFENFQSKTFTWPWDSSEESHKTNWALSIGLVSLQTTYSSSDLGSVDITFIQNQQICFVNILIL